MNLRIFIQGLVYMKHFYLLFFICFGFSYLTLAKEVVVEKTLAIVEGEMISLMDLKETRRRLKAGFLDDFILLSLFQKKQLINKSSALLEFMIYEKLLDISAQESNMEIKEVQLKQEVEKIRKKKRLSKKAFSRWLVKNRWTSASYRSFLRKSLLRKRLVQQEVIEKIQISDEDLNTYALQKEGKALFSTFEYDLSYLLFSLGKEGELQAQRAFKLISQDNSLFDKGEGGGAKKGQFKKIKLSALSSSIREEIKKLSVGQVSPVLVSPAGRHIFKALWKTPVITAKNQKRKARLSVLLFEELFKKKLKSWLENRKARAFIQHKKG